MRIHGAVLISGGKRPPVKEGFILYHSNLQIQIFGDHGSLADVLAAITPLDRFEHSFSSFAALSQEAVAAGDILILPEDASAEMLWQAESWRKAGSVTVLCCTSARLAELQEAELAAADLIWPLPLTPALAQFEFSALQKTLKDRKDAWLTRRWLDTAIDSIPELVWFKDIRGAHLKVNDSFCSAVSKTKEQIQGRGHYYIWDIPEDEYQRGEYICLESEAETMRRRKTCLFDEKVKTKQGMRQFQTYKSPIFDEDGKTILGTVGVAHDVTELRNMNNELEIVFNSIPLGILICDSDWTISSVRGRIGEYFSIDGKDLLRKNYQDWKRQNLTEEHPGIRPGYQEAMLEIGGDRRVLEFLEEPITDIFQNVTGYLCLYGDVTMERKYEEEMFRSANRDFLTGFYNRRYFYEFLTRNRSSQPLALLYMDIDDFKQVNDRFGHQYGDKALAMAAEEIRTAFPGCVTARMGGDEFVTAVVGQISREELASKADSLLRGITGRTWMAECNLPMSISIGISCTANPGVSVDELVRQADIAMYISKRSGKCRYCFYAPDMDTREHIQG